jgi:hypothetical protein
MASQHRQKEWKANHMTRVGRVAGDVLGQQMSGKTYENTCE